jgi:Suppressor of fused protein (SUFU).
MSNKSEEHSQGGQPIYRHQREKEFQAPDNSNVFMDEIIAHFEKHIGTVSTAYHEIISDLVHIDIHMIEPSKDRDFYTFFTTGMSDKEMNVPEGAEDYKLGELMICLPKDWKLSEQDFKDERNYWPFRWLKILARLPHEYDTWLGFGHTIPNGDPARPFADNTKLSCLMLSYPLLVDNLKEFYRLELADGRAINFYSVLPLYREEMDFKLKHSAEDLLDKFDEHGVNELLETDRKNVCKKKFIL